MDILLAIYLSVVVVLMLAAMVWLIVITVRSAKVERAKQIEVEIGGKTYFLNEADLIPVNVEQPQTPAMEEAAVAAEEPKEEADNSQYITEPLGENAVVFERGGNKTLEELYFALPAEERRYFDELAAQAQSYPDISYSVNEREHKAKLGQERIFRLQIKNDVEKSATVTIDKVLMRFTNEMVISGYTCTEPLELNKDYDVTTLDCKDEEGNDPFADMKSQIGVPTDVEMTFGEKSLAFKDPSSEPLVLERLGDEGCTCYKNLRA